MLNFSKNSRLGAMMFLQYALWGAWLPVTARYLSATISEGGLGFTGSEIGMILGLAGSIGAIAAPFIAGQIADRYFSTERVLAILVTAGGAVKWITAYQTEYGAWLILSILYSVLYMPTLALSNSITFSHIDDQENNFPKIRVWGTIGWIVASWVFPMIWLQQNLHFQWMPPFIVGSEVANVTSRLADALKFSGLISLSYGAFCFLLPHTPPKRNAVEKLAFKKAFELFKETSFTILVVASLAVSVIHQIYFLQTGPFLSHIGILDSQIGPAMTIGQFAEIITMAYLGFFLKRLGFHKVVTEIFDKDAMLPAAGQGTIVVQTTLDNKSVINLLKLVNDKETEFISIAERSCLDKINGACDTPIGVNAVINDDGEIFLRAELLSIDGKKRYSSHKTGIVEKSKLIGYDVAEEILDQAGTDFIIKESKLAHTIYKRGN